MSFWVQTTHPDSGPWSGGPVSYKVHVEECLEKPILLLQLAWLFIFTRCIILWQCLWARWRRSLTESILIELGRLPGPYHTITLCGCKTLHRQPLQPCRLLRLQLPKQLIGHYANALSYDWLRHTMLISNSEKWWWQSSPSQDCAVNFSLTFKTVC